MSQLTLTRNSPSGIRLPSISTLTQQSNIRLPDFKSSSSPKNIKVELLPSIISIAKDKDASTAASLVQLSQNNRTLPQPIVPSPPQETNLEMRSNSDSSIYAKKESPFSQAQSAPPAQQQPQQQPAHHTAVPPPQPTQQIRAQSFSRPPPAGYSYSTPPPPSRVYYSPSEVHQQYHQQQAPVYYPQHERRSEPSSLSKASSSLKGQLSCQRCGTTETPEWRRGPNGARTLCNACGLYHAKLVKRKGALAAAEEMKFKKVKASKPSKPRGIVTAPYHHGYVQDNVVLSKYHADMLHHQLQNQPQHLAHNQHQQHQQYPQEYSSGGVPYHLYQYEQQQSHGFPPPPPPPQPYSPRDSAYQQASLPHAMPLQQQQPQQIMPPQNQQQHQHHQQMATLPSLQHISTIPSNHSYH